ncbi:MAG: hypothetical protein M0004_16780 [Actinomycetota bacterium]|nr:hypothetical protein [Actinomycetota bacterium]
MAAHPAVAASVSGDRSSIGRLEAAIAHEGTIVQSLVSRANAAQVRENAIQAHLAQASRELVSERATMAHLTTEVRQVAISAYVAGGSTGVGLGAPSTNADLASVYANVATSRFDQVLTSYSLARHRIGVARSVLRIEGQRERTTLRQLRSAEQTANQAVARDEQLLSGVRGNLQGLLAAAAAREAAARRAQEQALARAEAAAAAAAAATSTTTTAPPAPHPARAHVRIAPRRAVTHRVVNRPLTTASQVAAPTGYLNPLRGIAGLSPERIDQGVDYSGYGPIFAIGDGVVLSTVNGGWPGGTYITYRLTDGPAAGLVVYAAEDINPTVSVGESVNADTVIGTVYGGPDGIETGWANGSLGDTMAAAAGQFYGDNTTAFGANFSALLTSLGAPGGLEQNAPSGALPLGWPNW